MVKYFVGTQVPPFKQESLLHGFILFSQVKPKAGEIHSHLNCPLSTRHLPPLLHGDDLQGLAIEMIEGSEMNMIKLNLKVHFLKKQLLQQNLE